VDLAYLASTDLPRDTQVQRNSGECIIQHGASKQPHRIEEDILWVAPKFEVSIRIRLEQSLGTTRNTHGGTKPWEAAASEVSSDVDRWKVGAGMQHTLLLQRDQISYEMLLSCGRTNGDLQQHPIELCTTETVSGVDSHMVQVYEIAGRTTMLQIFSTWP
jgi:hypothetical protein